MKITVLVKTKSKRESIEQQADGSFVVRVHTPPVDGAANERVRELLAEFLNRPKTSLQLIAGLKSTRKIFEY